jgi:DNA-binding transcriptional regulator YdaS (Cro superfamily)
MANNDSMKFTEWVNEQRGRSLAIAQAVGVTPPVVSDWVTGKKGIPLERCTAIERATGGAVTRKDLRPDDWQDHWPELSPALANTAQPATESVAPTGDPIQPDAMRSGDVRRHDTRRGKNPDYDGGRRETGPFPPDAEAETVAQGVANV